MSIYISTRYACRLYVHMTLYIKGVKALLSNTTRAELENQGVEIGTRSGITVHRLMAEKDRLHFLVEITSGQSVGRIADLLQGSVSELLRARFASLFSKSAAVLEKGYAARTAGIPYLHLRAASPLAGWSCGSEFDALIHIKKSSQINTKKLALICARPDVVFRRELEYGRKEEEDRHAKHEQANK